MTATDVKSAKPFEYKVKKENPSPRQMRSEKRVINCIMVEAAGVEPTVVRTATRVYRDLPNVYRISTNL
jgi:hypothetical protein